MKNDFTVNVKGWFCEYNLNIGIKEWYSQELRVIESTGEILSLLKIVEIFNSCK